MFSLILNLFQLIIYSLINPAKAKYKYFKIEGFICSLIGLPAFKDLSLIRIEFNSFQNFYSTYLNIFFE